MDTHTHTHTICNTTKPKKEENFAICGNMGGPLFMLHKINQIEKNKHCMIPLIWGI